MANKLERENENLKTTIEELQSKLAAIEQSQQQKTKLQLGLGKIGLGFLLGSGLKSSMRKLYAELPANVQKNTVADITTEVIWRITRVGLIGLLIAMIPTVLLWQQNQRIDEQTKLFEKQNEKIDAQIQLEESSRRGNLIVLMSNIMDKVDDELTRDWNNDEKRNISPQLIGRIAALSYSFRPYRFWQDSSLIEKPLSPERGQLLLALVKSDLDTSTYQRIYKKATFKEAYLEGVNLKGVHLKNAILNGVNLQEAGLVSANMWNVNLHNANLSYVHMMDANLQRAKLWNTKLWGANLTNADLSGATVLEKNWLTLLDEWQVIGSAEIKNKYEIGNYKEDGGLGYYLIKEKK